jgi:hypothetical protein
VKKIFNEYLIKAIFCPVKTNLSTNVLEKGISPGGLNGIGKLAQLGWWNPLVYTVHIVTL